MAVCTELRLVAIAAYLAYQNLRLMCFKPVLGMLAGMACGAQVLLYCWSMLDIGVAVVTGNLVVRDVVFMHETEIIIFFNSFPDIMA
jgi:hypothetical protein